MPSKGMKSAAFPGLSLDRPARDEARPESAAGFYHAVGSGATAGLARRCDNAPPL